MKTYATPNVELLWPVADLAGRIVDETNSGKRYRRERDRAARIETCKDGQPNQN